MSSTSSPASPSCELEAFFILQSRNFHLNCSIGLPVTWKVFSYFIKEFSAPEVFTFTNLWMEQYFPIHFQFTKISIFANRGRPPVPSFHVYCNHYDIIVQLDKKVVDQFLDLTRPCSILKQLFRPTYGPMVSLSITSASPLRLLKADTTLYFLQENKTSAMHPFPQVLALVQPSSSHRLPDVLALPSITSWLLRVGFQKN